MHITGWLDRCSNHKSKYVIHSVNDLPNQAVLICQFHSGPANLLSLVPLASSFFAASLLNPNSFCQGLPKTQGCALEYCDSSTSILCWFYLVGFKHSVMCGFLDCTRSPGSTSYDDKSNCRTIWMINYTGAKVIHSLPQKSEVFPELSCEEDHHRQWLFCSGKTLDMITPCCR